MRNLIGVALIASSMSLALMAAPATSAAAQQIVSQGTGCCGTVDFTPRRRHIGRHRSIDRSYVGFYYRPYQVRSCAYVQPYGPQSYPCHGPVPYAYGFKYGPLWW